MGPKIETYPGPKPEKVGSMKPFHWTKLPGHECQKAIWSSSKDLYREQAWKTVASSTGALEQHFSAKSRKRSSIGGKRGDGDAKDKSATTNLLDLRRAQNISIMLSKFRCEPSHLREVVMQLDPTVLSSDDVHMLKLFIPTEEEANMLRSHSASAASLASLGIAERFFLEILEVPRYKERLMCFEYLNGFDDRDREVTRHLAVLSACFIELQQCHGLHHFMEVLLAVGNFMNYGTSMGNATGFRLEALDQAARTRSKVDSTSLIDLMVARMAALGQEAVLHFPDALAHLEAASKISLSHAADVVMQVATCNTCTCTCEFMYMYTRTHTHTQITDVVMQLAAFCTQN
jgi:hypothetical protein